MLSAGRVPVNNGRSGAFQVHGIYFKRSLVLAVVLKTLDQQFKNYGYYFPKDSWQASEDSAITSWDLAYWHDFLPLSVIWLIWDLHVLLWWWLWWRLHCCCNLSRRKSLNKICTSLQRIVETWGKTFPLMFKLWAAVRSKMTHILCYSKRDGIDTWKLLLKNHAESACNFLSKRGYVPKNHPCVCKCDFQSDS